MRPQTSLKPATGRLSNGTVASPRNRLKIEGLAIFRKVFLFVLTPVFRFFQPNHLRKMGHRLCYGCAAVMKICATDRPRSTFGSTLPRLKSAPQTSQNWQQEVITSLTKRVYGAKMPLRLACFTVRLPSKRQTKSLTDSLKRTE